jgi:hypothetical protein
MAFPGAPDFSNLRLQQLFANLPQLLQSIQSISGPQGPQPGNTPNILPSPNTEAASVPPDNSSSLLDYQPERQASDMFMKHIGQMPTRDQYPVSKLREIGAALVGLGGNSAMGISGGQPIGFQTDPNASMNAAENFRNQPFSRALGDWELKTKPLEAAAVNEKNYNMGTRQLLLGVDANRIKQQNADTALKRATDTDENTKERNRTAAARARAYIWDKEHPDWKPYAQPGGNLIYTNPKDPSQVFDTGYESGKMDEEDKINLQTKGRLSVVAAQGKNQLENTAANVQGRKDVAESKGWQVFNAKDENGVERSYRMNLGTGDVELTKLPSAAKKPSSTSAANEGEGQKKVGDYRRARQALIDNPDWSQWVHLDTSGPNTFTVDPPSTGGFFSSGPDKATYNKINKAIYPDGKPEVAPATTSPAAAPKGAVKEPPPKGGDEEITISVKEIKTGKIIGPFVIKRSATEKPEFKAKYQVQ